MLLYAFVWNDNEIVSILTMSWEEYKAGIDVKLHLRWSVGPETYKWFVKALNVTWFCLLFSNKNLKQSWKAPDDLKNKH